MTASYLALLQEAVIETDAIARHYYTKRDFAVSQKADLSPVTVADQEIEQTLTRFFRKRLPDADILGEEYGTTAHEERLLPAENGIQRAEHLDLSRRALGASRALDPDGLGDPDPSSAAGANGIQRAEPFELKTPYSAEPSKGRLRVIIDPIDGTRNFVRGIPFIATLLAIELDGKIIAGLVSNPIQREQWGAELGAGATYNGSPIRVSSVVDLASSQAFHGSLYGSEAEGLPRDKVLEILSQTHRQRAMGDFYGHMLVASGAGEFSLDFGLKPWDIAPLKIIVEEAGGRVSNFDGRFSLDGGSLVCSNGVLHRAVLTALK
jgi:histidinol-phosphatase